MKSTTDELVTLLNELLHPERYSPADISWNGLQVEASTREVAKVGVAVDAGLSVIERAVAEGCQLLVVHHGLFWGSSPSPMVSGQMGQKIRALIEGGCSLYASHLPLDGDPLVGNAFTLGKAIGLTSIKSAFEFEGASIGAIGELPEPVSFSQFRDTVFTAVIPEGQTSITCELPFGTEKIQTVGVATGSASSLLPDAKKLGCDVLLSGEPKHEAYHVAKEVGVNALFAGHYLTETFGVKAVARHIEEKVKIATVFIDEPTGI